MAYGDRIWKMSFLVKMPIGIVVASNEQINSKFKEDLMKPSLIVIETIHAVPGKADELKAALVNIVPFSLSEPGCLHYEISQSASDPQIFLVIMKFKDNHNLEEHNNSKHIQEFVKKYDKKLYDHFTETHWTSC